MMWCPLWAETQPLLVCLRVEHEDLTFIVCNP